MKLKYRRNISDFTMCISMRLDITLSKIKEIFPKLKKYSLHVFHCTEYLQDSLHLTSNYYKFYKTIQSAIMYLQDNQETINII